MRATWLWPLTIMVSAGAAAVCTYVLPGSVIRPFVDMWFLFVCPGMALVRLFRLNNTMAEWMLALALSFALDGIVAGLLLYANHWSPTTALFILLNVSLLAAMAQVILTLLGQAGEDCGLDRGLHPKGGVSNGLRALIAAADEALTVSA